MKKQTIRTFALVLSISAFAVMLVLQPKETLGNVVTQPDSPLPNADPVIARYAQAINVSMEEAKQRLVLQDQMGSLANKIATNESTFAGAWLEHLPNMRLFVAFASPNGKEILENYVETVEWRELVEARYARFTTKELEAMQIQTIQAALKTDIPFESGIDLPLGRIRLLTPKPDEMKNKLEAIDSIKDIVPYVGYDYKDRMSQPAELKYPYLLGNTALSGCTAGFVVMRSDNNRRAMSTAGHCSNVLTTNTGIVFGLTGNGNGWLENNPVPNPPVGPFGEDMDIQIHDASARSWDLTNVVWTSSTSTASVTSSQLKAGTLNKWVCKFGNTTGLTCGWIIDLYFAPSYAPSPRYVRVENSSLLAATCGGDSGSAVFESVAGGVSALGILSGGADVPCGNSGNTYFFYTPTDEINRAGYSILTTHYKQYFVQNVWWTETNCTEYKRELDGNGNPIGTQTSQSCLTNLPAGSSGTVETYDAYSSGEYWREAMWRGGVGYNRIVPLNSNGTINWGAAPAWSQCCTGTAPRAQGGYVLGNYFVQNVWWTETNCTEYRRPLDFFGNPTGTQVSQACGTSAPGNGTIQSYNAYPVHGKLREAIWRNNLGYVRDVPLNATNTDVNWSSAPAWTQCCSGTSPRAQGGDILTQQ